MGKIDWQSNIPFHEKKTQIFQLFSSKFRVEKNMFFFPPHEKSQPSLAGTFCQIGYEG